MDIGINRFELSAEDSYAMQISVDLVCRLGQSECPTDVSALAILSRLEHFLSNIDHYEYVAPSEGV